LLRLAPAASLSPVRIRPLRAWRAAAPAAGALLLAGCALPFFGAYPAPPPNAVPQVIAVTSFENRSGFAGQWELGSGMADLLVVELIKSQHFVVVERTQLDRVVDEIQRQRQKLFRPEGRVSEGRLKNARYLIRGTINDFSQTGGGTLWVALRSVFTLGRGGYRARVALALTIVDVETGEIVGSLNSTATVAAREAFGSGRYKNVSFGGDVFMKTPLGGATAEAIHDGVRGLLRKVPHVYWEPMVAAVSGRTIILNGGAGRGFQPGQLYDIRGSGRPVTDPVTGDLLSIIPGPLVGTIRVTAVRSDIAYAEAVNGSAFERGQRLLPAAHRSPP